MLTRCAYDVRSAHFSENGVYRKSNNDWNHMKREQVRSTAVKQSFECTTEQVWSRGVKQIFDSTTEQLFSNTRCTKGAPGSLKSGLS